VEDQPEPRDLFMSVLSAIGGKIFRTGDCRARDQGWQIIPRRGLSRTYWDPRFDYLMPCPACNGAAITPTAPPALPAARQVAPSSTKPIPRCRGEYSRNESGHELAPHWYRDTRMTTDLRRALVTVAPPNPLVATWRWRYEIALLAGLAVVLTIGITTAGALPTLAVVVTAITLPVLGLPPMRQFVLSRAWCIITAHRVRVGCAEAMIYSSRGKIPVILWTAHQPFGERVLLWCRAGTSIDDFITNRAILTSAC
jgi:hypothetical protein